MSSPFFVRHGLNVNNFLVVNSTTVAVGANVVSNNTTQRVGNSTVRSIITATSTQVANSTINTTIGPGTVSVGANNIANSTAQFIGNSTVNTVMTSTTIQVTNSTSNSVITPASIFVGNSVSNIFATSSSITIANSTVNVALTMQSITVGANLAINTSAYAVGNSTSNIAITGVNIKFPDASVQNSAPFGKTLIWLPAGSWKSRANAGATAGSYESVTNLVNVDVFDFSATVNNHIQFAGQLPKSWNGNTFTYQTVWLMPNTTVNFGVVWSVAATSIANNGSIDSVFGTAINVTSTGAVNNSVYISPESANVTIGNSPGIDPYVIFQASRLPGDAADTLAVVAKFLGLRIWFTSNKVNDA